MDINRLQLLLSRDEGPKLDFKAKLSLRTESEKKDLAKLVSAIANSRGGRGYLIYGIADKTKEVLGVDPTTFQEEQIQQIISSRCIPPIPLKVDVLPYKQKHIAVITIYRSEQRPHQLRDTGSFFIRRGSTTDTAQRVEIAAMLQEVGLVVQETTPIFRATVEHIDLAKITQAVPLLENLPEQILMANLVTYGLVYKDSDTNKYHPTVGGMLLFGKDVMKFLPHAHVKVILGKSHGVFYLSGTIFEVFDQFQHLVKKHVHSIPLPTSFLDEALANALVHRDYWQLHRYVIVQIKDTWISFINPGSLLDPNSITAQQSLHPLRNPWLFQNLLTFDPKKRFFKTGLGFTRIQNKLPSHITVNFNDQPDKNLFQLIFTIKP